MRSFIASLIARNRIVADLAGWVTCRKRVPVELARLIVRAHELVTGDVTPRGKR